MKPIPKPPTFARIARDVNRTVVVTKAEVDAQLKAEEQRRDMRRKTREEAEAKAKGNLHRARAWLAD